jgi:hypothetical protein
MPSIALQHWRKDAHAALDQVADVHSALSGSGAGRRHAAQEIRHAYAVLLGAHFQRFCRDLHSEAVLYVVAAVAPPPLRHVFSVRLMEGRKLDRGNPNPANLGSDFGRFGFDFWAAVDRRDARNVTRRALLEQLSAWRNAIAHQDFDPMKLVPPPPLRLAQVKVWRSACAALAHEFDRVIRDQLAIVVGKAPW